MKLFNIKKVRELFGSAIVFVPTCVNEATNEVYGNIVSYDKRYLNQIKGFSQLREALVDLGLTEYSYSASKGRVFFGESESSPVVSYEDSPLCWLDIIYDESLNTVKELETV